MTNNDIKTLCYRIIDFIDYQEKIDSLKDCNTCLCQKNCKYAPRAGEFTRINCFAWVGEEREE